MAHKLDQIFVVDVESTCWDGPPPDGRESEIIEIGWCFVDDAAETSTENYRMTDGSELSHN